MPNALLERGVAYAEGNCVRRPIAMAFVFGKDAELESGHTRNVRGNGAGRGSSRR